MGLGITLDNAAIMSTVLEGILYGVFLARLWKSSSAKYHAGFSLLMFIGTVWMLTHGKDHHPRNRVMILLASVFLVLSTAVSALVDGQTLNFLTDDASLCKAYDCRYCAHWRGPSKIQRYLSRRTAGVLRRRCPNYFCDEECNFHLANACWRWGGGRSRLSRQLHLLIYG